MGSNILSFETYLLNDGLKKKVNWKCYPSVLAKINTDSYQKNLPLTSEKSNVAIKSGKNIFNPPSAILHVCPQTKKNCESIHFKTFLFSFFFIEKYRMTKKENKNPKIIYFSLVDAYQVWRHLKKILSCTFFAEYFQITILNFINSNL